MPAPSLQALLNFDGQLAFAARQILAAGGFALTWQRGDSGVRPNACVAVVVDVGEANGRHGMRPEGVTEPAMYTATLGIMVALERDANAPTPGGPEGTPLDRECARVRALFVNYPNPFAAYQDAQGVYVQVASITPLAPQYDVAEDDAVDSRILNFAIEFLIPDSAWPAVG